MQSFSIHTTLYTMKRQFNLGEKNEFWQNFLFLLQDCDTIQERKQFC